MPEPGPWRSTSPSTSGHRPLSRGGVLRGHGSARGCEESVSRSWSRSSSCTKARCDRAAGCGRCARCEASAFEQIVEVACARAGAAASRYRYVEGSSAGGWPEVSSRLADDGEPPTARCTRTGRASTDGARPARSLIQHPGPRQRRCGADPAALTQASRPGSTSRRFRWTSAIYAGYAGAPCLRARALPGQAASARARPRPVRSMRRRWPRA